MDSTSRATVKCNGTENDRPGGSTCGRRDSLPGVLYPEETDCLMHAPSEIPGVYSVTFYEYLSDSARSGVKIDDMLAIEPLYHRLAYLTRLCEWMERNGHLSGVLRNLFGTDRALTPREATGLSRQTIRRALLTIEAETRMQVSCDLWKVLRQFLITASTLKWTKDKPCSKPDWFRINEFRNAGLGYATTARALTFGLTNESCARLLTMAYFIGWGAQVHRTGCEEEYFEFNDPGHVEEESFTCGLLLDLNSGMIGASMDMMICPRSCMTGHLEPGPHSNSLRIFEIKCRAKYTFSVDNKMHPLVPLYEKLLRSPSESALRDFLYGICSPGVEYFNKDGAPTANEALVTVHPDWGADDAKMSRKCSSSVEKRHLTINNDVMSTVFLFNPPDLDTQTISLATWASGDKKASVPLFVNAKHSNFKQILVQSYVLSGYFPDHELEPYLVTFVGRERCCAERGFSFTLADCLPGFTVPPAITPLHAIPVLLIISPVRIDRRHFSDFQSLGGDAFSFSVKETWARVSRDHVVQRAAAAGGTTS